MIYFSVMNQSIRKFIFLAVLTLCHCPFARCQSVTSARDGLWNDPSTWTGGIVPTSATALQVIIDHSVILEDYSLISIPRITLNKSLTLGAHSNLHISGDGDLSTADLQVYGALVSMDSAVIDGTTASNAHFERGSVYVHRQGPAGYIPIASWDPNSTFQISGFTASGYINIAHSTSWKQHFGNVIYDCPLQSVFVVDLNGYLSDIAGNLIIRNTNHKTLRLSTTQRAAISIGGDLVIEGPSELWFSTNAASCEVNVNGNFRFESTSTGPSYMTTRGVIDLSVAGKMTLNSLAPLRMCSSATDSSGIRQPTLNLSGDLSIEKGSIIAPPLGNGQATIIFNGTARQHLSVTPPVALPGNMHYVISPGTTLDLGTAALTGDPGSLSVKGNLSLGSTDPGGAIQLSDKGNILVPGPRTFDSGSSIEYNASLGQVIGDGHPSTGIDLVANNAQSLSLGTDLSNVGNLKVLRGKLDAASHKMVITGDASFNPGTEFTGVLRLSGNRQQTLSGSGLTFDQVVLDKEGGGIVDLISTLNIRSTLSILSSNTSIRSNGYLTLLSAGDEAGQTASVQSIPGGSSVEGDVTVQRSMSGEGRIYRYLSCPVSNGSVEMIMDDFPVTGTFDNPSTGASINSGIPSLFQYDESVGGLAEGWKAVPTSGLASGYMLQPGKGYAAFIRNSNSVTTVDYTGRLNQGEVVIPMNFTPGPGDGHGWNLVGNPYPSSIEWSSAGTGWTKTNISEVISIRDNGGGGIYHYTDGEDGDIAGGRIASGQSFWVRAIGMSPNLIINESAKVAEDAEFYRKKIKSVPAFTLRVDQDTLSDLVCYKVRRDASDSLDRWDGVKLSNDRINLAWRNHGLPDLAIQANNKLPCGEEIPVSVTGLQSGKFSLTLNARSGLENFDFMVMDHLYDSAIRIKNGSAIEFKDVPDGRVATQARFSIMVAPPSLKALTADLMITTCNRNRISIRMTGTVAGLSYSLWKDHQRLTDPVKCESSDPLEFYVADTIDLFDLSALEVCVTSECGGHLTKTVAVAHPAIAVMGPDKVCEGQTVILNATYSEADMHFRWFEDANGKTLLSDSSKLVTGPLRKPVTYFVCGTSAEGCLTNLQRVGIDVKPLINLNDLPPGNLDFRTLDEGDLLRSFAYPWDDRMFKPPLNTDYLYSSGYDACVSIDSLRKLDKFLIKGKGISMYPNPVSGFFTITSAHAAISGVSIFDADGQAVNHYDFLSLAESDYSWRVNCVKLPDGVYLAIVKLVDGNVHCIRFARSGNGGDDR